MGLILKHLGDKKGFEDHLRHTFGLERSQYQILEYLFRQGMMNSEYSYDKETRVPSKLLERGRAKSLIEEAKNAIQRWEKESGGQYGFEGIEVTEIHEHSFLVEEYNRLLRELRSKDGLRSKLISKDIRDSWEKTLAAKLKDLLQYKEKQGRGYVTFDEEGFADTVATQFDYFSRYIYLANAVFNNAIELAAGAAANNKLGVAAFISEKIQFEHAQIEGIDKFRASIIKDRLKSGSRAEEEATIFRRNVKNFDEVLEIIFTY